MRNQVLNYEIFYRPTLSLRLLNPLQNNQMNCLFHKGFYFDKK